MPRITDGDRWNAGSPRDAQVCRKFHSPIATGVDDGKPAPMGPVDGEAGVWSVTLRVPDARDACSTVVHAQSGDGSIDEDRIDVLTPGAAALIERSDALPGTDAHAVEAWSAHGVFGSQLGRNRYGRQ